VLISLERFAYTPEGTFGRLTVGGNTFYTVELPWKGNKPRQSCIPESRYPLRMRESNVVSRSSGNEFTRGWEICDVPDRSYIMLHPGNWPSDLLGCVAPGLTFGVIGGKIGIGSSRSAFRKVMAAIPDGEHEIEIFQYHAEYS